MRANPDVSPPAQVATRDSDLRWSLRATARDVTFRDGAVAAPAYPVLDTSMGQQVLAQHLHRLRRRGRHRARADTAVATGAGAIARRRCARPSCGPRRTRRLDLQCATPHVRYAITLDLLRNAGLERGAGARPGPARRRLRLPGRPLRRGAGRRPGRRRGGPARVRPLPAPGPGPHDRVRLRLARPGRARAADAADRRRQRRPRRPQRERARHVLRAVHRALRSGRAARSFRLAAGCDARRCGCGSTPARAARSRAAASARRAWRAGCERRTCASARGQSRSTGQPLRSHSGTPPSTTWMTSVRAVALQQARGDRGALAGAAHDRDGPRGVDAVRHAVDVVVGHVDRAGDVAGRPTRSARARRAPAGGRRPPSARAARARSCAPRVATGRRSSRQDVMPPAR